MRRLLPALVIALAAVAPTAVAGDSGAPDCLQVVANVAVPADSLSAGQLQRIYLGKTTRWDGGLVIRPVMLQDHTVHEAFVEELLDRSEESFSVYWKRMVFTGKGRPPRAFATDADLAAYLRETPGAIGFLPAAAEATGLKTVVVH